jgi:hypothetical protein
LNANFDLDGKRDNPYHHVLWFDWISGDILWSFLCVRIGLCIGVHMHIATIGVLTGMAAAMDLSLALQPVQSFPVHFLG